MTWTPTAPAHERTGPGFSWSRPTSSTASDSTRPPTWQATSGRSPRRSMTFTLRLGVEHSWSSFCRANPCDWHTMQGVPRKEPRVAIAYLQEFEIQDGDTSTTNYDAV